MLSVSQRFAEEASGPSVHCSEMYPLLGYHVVLGPPKWMTLWYDIWTNRWTSVVPLASTFEHSHHPRGCWPTRLCGGCANRSFEVQMRCVWVCQYVTKMGFDTISPVQELQYSSQIMWVKQKWTNESPLFCWFIAAISLNWGWMILLLNKHLYSLTML